MKESRRSPDHRGLFVVGLALMVIGIATGNIAFLGAGVVFFILGLKGQTEEQL
ncbi:MAG: hypothetical protein JSV68_09500 [Anaerolineaceae bacterium]|nr:MAG: hypothetical protein JSV68_09500 [Anaerolineaceae bacterium]